MSTNIATRSCRLMAVALVCSTAFVGNLWADPVTVTSGQFVLGRGPAYEGRFTFSGTGGFFLDALGTTARFVTASCAPSGCRSGDVFNLSVVAGTESGLTSARLPAPFTLGTAFGAVVDGTEFVPPSSDGSFPGPLGLAGSFRFEVPPIVLPSSGIVSPGQPSPFAAPFVFTGHVTGFRITDVDARTPLFDVTLTGRGMAFGDFEQESDGTFRSDIFRFTFADTPAPVPEPATLALLGTGLLGLFSHARTRRRGRRDGRQFRAQD